MVTLTRRQVLAGIVALTLLNPIGLLWKVWTPWDSWAANSTTRSPIIVDTPGAGTILATSRRIVKVRWVGATTAGHTAVIQDSSDSRNVWESIAAGSNYVEDNVMNIAVAGIKVPTLSSGKLYIHVE